MKKGKVLPQPTPKSADAAPESPPVPLEMENVDVTAIETPELVVLEGVNWTVAAGEYWVVGGLPGAGKSDLLSTAAGLVRPRSGRHRLFGQDMVGLREQERLHIQRRVGVVFGFGGRLFKDLSVEQNLALPLCYHQNCSLVTQQDRVQMLLHAMGLEDVAEHLPGSINRNLRQRVALARALVLGPELLFLIYPLVGIDGRELHWLLRFLDKLREGDPLLGGKGLTLVVSTDDLAPWGESACQFGLIQGRQFLSIGSRDQLRQRRNEWLPGLVPTDWLKE